MLADAVRAAAAAAAVRLARPASHAAIVLSFGAPQGTDVRPIRRDDLTGTGKPLNHQAVANYIAKYATKTLTVPGLPDARIRHQADIADLRCSAHHKQMIITAWQLGSKRAGRSCGPRSTTRSGKNWFRVTPLRWSACRRPAAVRSSPGQQTKRGHSWNLPGAGPNRSTRVMC